MEPAITSPGRNDQMKSLIEKISKLEHKITKRDRIISSLKDQRSQLTKDLGILTQENHALKAQIQEQGQYFTMNLSELQRVIKELESHN